MRPFGPILVVALLACGLAESMPAAGRPTAALDLGVGMSRSPADWSRLGGTGLLVAAGVGQPLSERLRLTADIAYERFAREAAAPAATRVVRDGCSITTALLGAELHGARAPRRGEGYVALGAGVGCAREGAAYGSDGGGRAWTERARAIVGPALGAGLGVRVPSADPRLAFHVGVRTVALFTRDGVRAALLLRLGLAG